MKLRGLPELRADIRERGVFPELVIEEIESVVDTDSIRDWFCWHREEAGGAAGRTGQQVIILAMTDTRFLYLNADDAPYRHQPCWSTGVTVVPLGAVTSVTRRSRRISAGSEDMAEKQPDVAYLVVSWNTDKKINASVHDYDASVRVDSETDGEANVERLREFGAGLARAVATAS